MTISVLEIAVPTVIGVTVGADSLGVELSDGRFMSAPIAWYPRLSHGTDAERADWRLIAGGQGIHWEQLDEDISVESLIAGRASAETQGSLGRWLDRRAKGRKAETH